MRYYHKVVGVVFRCVHPKWKSCTLCDPFLRYCSRFNCKRPLFSTSRTIIFDNNNHFSLRKTKKRGCNNQLAYTHITRNVPISTRYLCHRKRNFPRERLSSVSLNRINIPPT